ncbi:hypothetical protein HYT74_03520 [Candidatus Daviesbacteria bacterium]|nr:hypothetical protein [Candidatus Daviesbacteria bacterium]
MAAKKSLTNFILLALEKSVDGYVRFEDFAYHHYRYHYGIPELKKAALSQALKRLREKGLIELVSDEKLAYRLTNAGKNKAVWEAIAMDDLPWDGRWRVVVFDIPEDRRQARNILRASLKKWGFAPWQQSVWATKKNCTKPLREFIKNVGIEDWVIVLESDNTGR